MKPDLVVLLPLLLWSLSLLVSYLVPLTVQLVPLLKNLKIFRLSDGSREADVTNVSSR